MEEEKISLELTVTEANTVLAALQEMPYRAVSALLAKIVEQARAQTQKPIAEEAE